MVFEECVYLVMVIDLGKLSSQGKLKKTSKEIRKLKELFESRGAIKVK